jgi:hypothetical protein
MTAFMFSVLKEKEPGQGGPSSTAGMRKWKGSCGSLHPQVPGLQLYGRKHTSRRADYQGLVFGKRSLLGSRTEAR